MSANLEYRGARDDYHAAHHHDNDEERSSWRYEEV